MTTGPFTLTQAASELATVVWSLASSPARSRSLPVREYELAMRLAAAMKFALGIALATKRAVSSEGDEVPEETGGGLASTPV